LGKKKKLKKKIKGKKKKLKKKQLQGHYQIQYHRVEKK
jgi:hypothetical protein